MMNVQPHEEKYVLSPENMDIARELADALIARDDDKVAEMKRKLVLPLRRLKHLGKDYVLEHGLPTITAEIANDTDWLK